MSTAVDRIKLQLLALMTRVPAGRIVTHSTLANHLNAPPGLIRQIVSSLSEPDRQGVPWHRIVADGGAIGRHPERDHQIQRLRSEGTPVAPVGIVQELDRRRIVDLDAPNQEIDPAPVAPPSRSRGMKGRP